MNKKFSTLLAGMALVSAMAVNAQTTTLPSTLSGSVPTLAATENVEKLKEGVNAELYQLRLMGDYVLAMNEDSELELVAASTVDASNMASTLWCVTVTTEGAGKAPIFDFQNKATGQMLDIALNNLEDATDGQKVDPIVGGSVSGWAFWRNYESAESKPMFSYIDNETILGFTAEGADLKVVKIKASGYNRDNNSYSPDGGTNTYNDYLVNFTLVTPAEIYLTSEQLNTIFGLQEADHGLKLSFDKDVLGTDIPNPFNAQSFVTEEAVTYTNNGVEVPYLYVKQKENDAYLRVDTAYTNESGVEFLAYKWVTEWYDWNSATNKKGTEYANAASFLNSSYLKDQYKFLFKYTPKNDNVEIYIHTVTYKDRDAEGGWYMATEKGYNNHVSLQDLVKDQTRILTVDKEKQNTTITLGYGACDAVTPTRTSLADNVYFIQNAKGQYLASPIHKNGTIEWVTVNEAQDVNHMPAFQWIALKNNTTDPNNVSPMSFTNREYPLHIYKNVQLNKNADEDFYYLTRAASTTFGSDETIAAADELTITAVAPEFQGDKYLGYKKIAKDDLLVNKYTFNYYHPYAQNMYIAQSEDDSTLIVLEGKDAFVLDTVKVDGVDSSDEAYGFNDFSDAMKKRLPNLVQLYRTVYTIEKGDMPWNINKESKFNVSEYHDVAEADGNKEVGTVFFKENNCIDGTHYYAILTATLDGKVHKVNFTGDGVDVKAGVNDQDPDATLKSQVLDESRTSAFAIAPDNTPLYRRFNNVALGEEATDATDSLVFKEKYRDEYLMDENNPAFQGDLDYAGIWSEEKAEGHLAFVIDTAWLNRGSGNVKPQYLISTARLDQDEVATIPCQEDGVHVTPDGQITDDPYQCVHATKGKLPFHYGKYLVSFADSVANLSDVNGQYKQPYMDVDGGYTRVGFVKAIHSGDSLYILTNGFETMQPAELDTAMIIKAYTEQKINDKFIVNLQGDQHKNVTWSFRYVNPDMAGDVTEEGEANEFLFESNIYTEGGTAVNPSSSLQGQGKAALGFDHVVKGSIAPESAAWLKMQNGCLVLTRSDSKFDAMTTGADGALIFNAYQKADDQDMVTSNEEIAIEGVSVVAGDGQVTIQGAAGKNVVITNILGKVIANTVLTSDNATITVPAGIVAVAVEGEEAVKAIVK